MTDEERFTAQIREIAGADTYVPQHDRTDDRRIYWIPEGHEQFDRLPTLDEATLLDIGCVVWDRVENEIHWLYPKEWYNAIPDGYPIVSISGNVDSFRHGETNQSAREGFLAFGFITKPERTL